MLKCRTFYHGSVWTLTHYRVGFTFQTHNLSSANTMMKQCKGNTKKVLGFTTKNNSL